MSFSWLGEEKNAVMIGVWSYLWVWCLMLILFASMFVSLQFQPVMVKDQRQNDDPGKVASKRSDSDTNPVGAAKASS